jgi:hypothetical protein
LKLADVVRRLIGGSFGEYPPVNDLDSCKSRLEEIADHSGSPAQLMLKVQEFLRHQVPAEEAHRADLKAWAKTELAKLEERTPAGGSTKIGTAPVAPRRFHKVDETCFEAPRFLSVAAAEQRR